MNTRVSQLYGVGLDVEVRRINMQLIMQIQKRNDDGLSLRQLLSLLRQHDTNGTGVLDQETFEAALRKFNIFPTVVEIQALMRTYNKGGDHRVKLIDYTTFVASLRLPLEGRRAEIVCDAFRTINSEEGASVFTIA